jgi:hypothetical protein
MDRDYEIFEHVMRYRMTTREVLHRRFFSDSELNAVTKVTSRLADHGFLNRYELYPNRSYFTLGAKSASFLGISARKTRDLGPMAKAVEFGVLSFCCLTEEIRERLTVSELTQRHPDLLLSGVDNSHYYLDRDGDITRLAYLRVDLGGSVEHILRKCRSDLAARMAHPAFDRLVHNDRFLIALVTGREEKAVRLREATAGLNNWPLRFRVEAVPELVELVTHLYDV